MSKIEVCAGFIEQKHGRSGEFVLVTSRTSYVNQDGVTVAETVSSMIARP